jgi:hypothetical protein
VLCAIGVCATLAAGAVAFRAVALEITPELCHARLSLMGRKFFHQWSGEISLCQVRRMKGEALESSKCYPDEMIRNGATTFCQPAIDPDVETEYQRRLCRAELHSHEKIQRKCKTEHLPQIELGIPCGTVATVAALQDCIDFEAHGQNAIDFTRTVYGSVGQVPNEELRDCINIIFKAGQTYARKVMQIMGDQCELGVRDGRIVPPCPDPLAQKRLTTARRSFTKKVLERCESALTSHLVRFGPPCDALVNPTPSDYIDCLTTSAETFAMRGVSTVFRP